MAEASGWPRPRVGVCDATVPRETAPGRRQTTRQDVEGRRTADVGQSARPAARHHLPRPRRRRRLPGTDEAKSVGDGGYSRPDGRRRRRRAEAAAWPPAR